jgi:5'-nucleotidase
MNVLRHFLLLLALASCSHGGLRPDPALYDQLVIVGTNDFHGYLRPVESELEGQRVILGGAEWFAGHMRVLERKFGDRLLLLDGGDIFQGTLESNLFLGKPTVDFYNLLPYRAASVGNHEFDYGPRRRGDGDRLGALKDRMGEANFPFLQANIYWEKSGELWREKNLYPSVLVEAGGYKVGIIGLTTTSTPAKTLPQNVAGLEFRDFLDPTLREARALRAQGAELVLITTHEGGEKPGEPLYELLQELPDRTVDAVVSGHAHSEIREFVHGVPVIQSRSRGLFFGRIDLFVNRSTRKVEPKLTKIHELRWICGTWFREKESCDQKWARDGLAAGTLQSRSLFPLRPVTYEGELVKPDLQVRRVLEPYFAAADKKKTEVLGRAQTDFDWYPSGESQMGFLFIEASRMGFPEARVVFHNGGGIRRRFFQGPITYGDLYEVHPFDNYAVAVRMTGRQLKDLVRVGVSGNNTIPALWGVRVEYFDKDSPAFDRDLNMDGKNEKWERDRLHRLVWEDTGRPVGDREQFWVATNDYLASGGDNTAHVFGSIPPSGRRFLDSTQRDLVAEYLRKNPQLVLPRQDEMRVRKVE